MPVRCSIVNLTIVALYYFGAGQIDVGTLTAGEIMALVQYVTLILMSLMMISMLFAILPRTLAATFQVVSVSVSLLRVVFCARPISISSTIPSRRSTSRLMHACARESAA